MRNIVEVIDRLIAEIPESEEALISDLRDLQQSARFSAPELMAARWRQGATVLNRHMPTIEHEWQQKATDIWLDRVA